MPLEDRITNFVIAARRKATIWFKVFFCLLVELLLVYLAIVFAISLVPLLGNASRLLIVLDRYAPLVLSSWPLAGLILGLTLLLTQNDSIDEFIRKRMTKAGPGGIEGKIVNPQEAQAALSKEDNLEQPSPTAKPEPVEVVAVEKVAVSDVATVETSSDVHPSTLTLTDQTKELQKELAFERIYNSIFGTQISVLVWLRNNLADLWYTALANVYEQWRTGDVVLQNYSLDNYITFLIANGLMQQFEEMGTRKFRITDHGLDFLAFMERRGYSKEKPH